MKGLTEWFLERMKLVDEDYEEPEDVTESEIIERSWPAFAQWKREKMPGDNGRIFVKDILLYEDCKAVIDQFKIGAVCLFCLHTDKNWDAQGMMNYICGGIYALGGVVTGLSGNVFMVQENEERSK